MEKIAHTGMLHNHTGGAGAMETVGMIRIFARSVEQNNLRYTFLLEMVAPLLFKIFTILILILPGHTFTKGKYISHIQKHVGSRLRK